MDEIVVLTGNIHRGSEILHNAVYNKGTGFNHSERERLGVRGLVPPRYFSIKEQAEKVWQQQVAMRESNAAKIGRWRHLQALKDRNETLFYRLLQDHVEELAFLEEAAALVFFEEREGCISRRTTSGTCTR